MKITFNKSAGHYYKPFLGNYTGVVEYSKGIKYWYKNGKIHRGNGKPAVVFPDDKEKKQEDVYYIDGKPVSKKAAQIYGMLFKEKEVEEEEKNIEYIRAYK